MKGEKDYFQDELLGSGLQLRTHIDTDEDLWLGVMKDGGLVGDSVLLSKSEALRLANVLIKYAGEQQ